MFRFEVGYAPGDPRTLRQWLVDREAVAVANGGFFTPEWIATGLLISDGQRFGASYGPRAGMVAIPEDGPPQVRWLQATPYDPSEALAGGIQAFPMLVRPGGQIGVPDELPNDRPDRRTAIGQDGEGRLLFIIAPRGGLTLHAFSQTLAGGGFGLDVALNLDGGTSSGLLWVEGGETAGIPPFSPLPVVLLVLPK